MACLLTTGRKLPCKSAFGGIKTIYFADFGGLTAVTIDATTKQVTGFTGSVTGWTKWDVKGSSSLETTVTSSRENGTTFYTQTLNATFTYLDAKTQAELQLIAVARPYVAVTDYYGNTFLCGFENGVELTGGTVVTGAAAGDLSGFTITMEGMEETAPYFLSSDALLTPIDNDQIAPTG
tara:strand:+ start:1016 stop:1552 length:537 start_codon:yes stop_codon:yes gene_type:complete